MRQETVDIYKFEELAEEVQQKLIDKYRYTEFNWWEYIEDEIKELGGELVEFDTYRNYIKLEIEYPIDFAKAIVANHGSDCDTYKISQQYLDGELVDKDYLHDISQEYLSMLRQEYEYITSDGYVREELINSEGEYYEDGREI